MFTGIVQDVGRLEELEARGGDVRLVIGLSQLDPARIQIGDSISVQGCCLTAIAIKGHTFAADVSRETLALTTLGDLKAGAPVNLEPRSAPVMHWAATSVSGHVDGVAQVVALSADARSRRLVIAVPGPLARYLAPKGSVAVDGVSLTVNAVDAAGFGVNIIPHTQAVTTLGALTVGARVNLEVDQVARYLARLLAVPRVIRSGHVRGSRVGVAGVLLCALAAGTEPPAQVGRPAPARVVPQLDGHDFIWPPSAAGLSS